MPMRKREDDEVFPNAAGIDVGGSSHWVAVPRHADDEPVREFGAMTDDLNAMADWLLACRVDTVALESTGVYWIPVYEVLEQRGLTVWLVDARQMKYVPGRKSDVQDCQWLQKLMSLGLLRAAWRPGDEVCVVRAVVRQRAVLLTEQSSWVLRMHKALVQMNIQLAEVLSDIMGASGQAIIRAIARGERDPQVLAALRNARVRRSEEDIMRALQGNWREEHLFVLVQSLAMYDSLAQRVLECDAKIEALLVPLKRHEIELTGATKRGSPNPLGFNARLALASWAGVDLTRINGISEGAALTILSEVGPDLSRFASVKHFCSWLSLCPGTKISGGKLLNARTRRSANRVRQALKMAAMSLARNDSALGAFTVACVPAWTSHGPIQRWHTSSRAWCTSCSSVAKPLLTRVSSAMRSSSVSAALRH
jgi:transposase